MWESIPYRSRLRGRFTRPVRIQLRDQEFVLVYRVWSYFLGGSVSFVSRNRSRRKTLQFDRPYFLELWRS